MTLLGIIDTETTGLGDDAEVIEVAIALYRIGTNHDGLISSASTLLPCQENPAEEVNGISAELSRSFGDVASKKASVERLFLDADYLVAFNADFDRPRWQKIFEASDHAWLCARNHFEWDDRWLKKPGSQIDLALRSGVGIIHAHRAGDDVRTLVACLDRHTYRKLLIEEAIARAASPRVILQAIVSYGDRLLAKDNGFYWDAQRKSWLREVCQFDVDRGTYEFPFDVLNLP